MSKEVKIKPYLEALGVNTDGLEIGNFSDGYHTFDELYEHRCLLFLLFAASYNEQLDSLEKQTVVDLDHESKYAWWSHYHHDGSFMEGWVIAGVKLRDKMITYHLPVKYVNQLGKHLRYLDRAPEWDGHTSQDVLDRMLATL